MLLVTGGGQGAAGLNQAVAQVLEFWLEHFQVVHLTGKNQPPLSCSHADYHAYPFVHQGIGNLLARSDLVVTRAGLGTLGELAYLAKDTVIVPLPGSHQELNCAVVVQAKAGVWLSQQQFLEEGTLWWKNFLAEYQPGLFGQNLHQLLPPGGTEAFTDLILKVARSSS